MLAGILSTLFLIHYLQLHINFDFVMYSLVYILLYFQCKQQFFFVYLHIFISSAAHWGEFFSRVVSGVCLGLISYYLMPVVQHTTLSLIAS